jgi:hypothetical protein
VFGPEKYLMRMTLSEAISDDLVALENCPFFLLPKRDASGRQVLYLDPSRHTREGYTSESLVSSEWSAYSIDLFLFHSLSHCIPWKSSVRFGT